MQKYSNIVAFSGLQPFRYIPKKKVKKSVNERIEDFKEMVRQWIRENDPDFTRPKWMYVEFVERYTEPTKGGRSFKYEQEKTWDTGRRVKKWESNSRLWHPKKWEVKEKPTNIYPGKFQITNRSN